MSNEHTEEQSSSTADKTEIMDNATELHLMARVNHYNNEALKCKESGEPISAYVNEAIARELRMVIYWLRGKRDDADWASKRGKR